MALLQSKQINKNLAAYVGLSGVSITSAVDVNVTSPLTNALATAGNGGVAVPLVAGGNATIEGVITGSTSVVQVFSNLDNERIIQGGEEVYGIITFSGGAYTVSFYTSPDGVQTPVTVNQSVNLYIPYSFTFEHYPYDANMVIQMKEVGGSATGVGTTYNDKISLTGTNTYPNLTQLPLHPNSVVMTVNGQTFYAGTHFTVTGQAVTQSAAQITAVGFNVVPSDEVFFEYEY